MKICYFQEINPNLKIMNKKVIAKKRKRERERQKERERSKSADVIDHALAHSGPEDTRGHRSLFMCPNSACQSEHKVDFQWILLL